MSVLDLADAKSHLNITAATYDAELQSVVDTAEAVIAAKCGPLTPTPVVRRIRASGAEMVLPSMPVVSLTVVEPVGGDALTLADLYLETSTGIVSWLDGGSFTGLYDVIYEGGRASVPADLLHAIKELVQHLWTSQRGGRGRGAEASNPAAYLLPYRVQTLIEPHLMGPGFA